MARLAIRMPKMSMTMTEGEVSSWLVEVGTDVAEGDVVCEVMTDKVEMEVESTVTGTLVEIAVESGMAEVGAPIGWVEGQDTGGGFGDLLSEAPAEAPADTVIDGPVEAAADAAPGATPEPGTEPSAERAPEPEPSAQHAPTPEPSPEPEPRRGPVAAVPRARGMAAERGIDLATVTGTGPDGLIRVGDIEALLPPAAPAEPQAPAVPTEPTPPGSPAGEKPDRARAVRLAVARAMAPTALVPQFTVWRQVHLDAADAVRRGVSWTTVLLRAYAAALREVPELLARWEDDGPAPSGPPCVALAVATGRGLLVPTFAEPDLGTAHDVDQQVRAVIAKAQTGKLDRANLGVANASLSNLGGMGVDRFQALLTPPQASVLSLGSIRRRPVAVPGGVGLALTVEAGLTVDHRVGDGAHAAEVLDRLTALLGGSL